MHARFVQSAHTQIVHKNDVLQHQKCPRHLKNVRNTIVSVACQIEWKLWTKWQNSFGQENWLKWMELNFNSIVNWKMKANYLQTDGEEQYKSIYIIANEQNHFLKKVKTTQFASSWLDPKTYCHKSIAYNFDNLTNVRCTKLKVNSFHDNQTHLTKTKAINFLEKDKTFFLD